MRIPTSAALAALGGALVLGLTVAPAAQATPAAGDCATNAFGIAGQYGEFVLGDDVHSPDAEGAVAVGGNADFRGGFSVGNELTSAQVDALPGRASLVVRGDLLNGGSATVVMKGNAVVGGSVKDRAVEMHNGTFAKKGDLIDFDGEFAKLRTYSDALAGEQATAGTEVRLDGTRLTLTGTDTGRNVFSVPASQLEKAKEVFVKVPAGATTVVNVTGASYDMASAGTTGFFLSGGQDFVLDDKLQSANGGAVRAALLWNFPDATKIVKSSQAAWPGSVLAPRAHLELGTGAPVNGSVWVASLHGSGGAETHHFPFTGCLPEVPGTTTPSPGTPTTTPPATGTPSASAPPTGSATPSDAPSGTPSGSASPGAPAPSASPSKPAEGDLATTGSSNMLPIALGGAAVVVAGAGLVVMTRRRKRA